MVANLAKTGKSGSGEFVLADLHGQLDAIGEWICDSVDDGSSATAVERGLFQRMLAMMKTLYQSFLTLIGPGDFGETFSLEECELRRSKELHVRRLLTVFGEFQIPRWVYAQREGATLEFLPTDQRLQLPASEVSFLLQEWDQLLGVDQAFGRVREVMETILRIPQSVDTLERTNQ